jgi:4-amino-4-deoxy-L-arabinose transferase-like glycosyltransferase
LAVSSRKSTHFHTGTLAGALLLLVLAVSVFFPFLGERNITSSHEARVAQTARRMAASGWPWDASPVDVPLVRLSDTPQGKRLAPLPDRQMMPVNPWIVPVMRGQIRLQKPPLPYWCAAIMYRLTEPGELAARFPGALLGMLGALLMFDLAGRYFGRRAALPAALVWVSSQFLVEQFRIATADPYLCFFTLAGFWALVTRRTVLLYVAVALGALAKGPLILLTLLPGIVFAQLLASRRAARRSGWLAHLVGVALLIAIAIPWYFVVYRQVPHALDLWRYESIGSLADKMEKPRPWWLYLGTTFRLPLPWTPMWIAGVTLLFCHGRRGLFSPRGKRRLLLMAWYVMVVLVFSFAHSKKDAYLLPLMPVMALTIADALAVLIAWGRRRRFADLPGILATTQAAIGIGAAAVVLVLVARLSLHRGIAVTLAAGATLLALGVLYPIFRAQPRRWLILQSIAYAAILVVLFGFQRPAVENQRSPRMFAAHLDELMHESHLPIMLERLPEEVTFYLPLQLKDYRDANRVLAVVDDSRGDFRLGARQADSAFFGEWFDDAQVIEVRSISVPDDGHGRWRLYELVLDRSRA